jgi:hypothetical protein
MTSIELRELAEQREGRERTGTIRPVVAAEQQSDHGAYMARLNQTKKERNTQMLKDLRNKVVPTLFLLAISAPAFAKADPGVSTDGSIYATVEAVALSAYHAVLGFFAIIWGG